MLPVTKMSLFARLGWEGTSICRWSDGPTTPQRIEIFATPFSLSDQYCHRAT